MDILSYSFTNPSLRQQALTHPSASSNNYQRLEFIGDRVLGLVVAHMLHQAFPQANEGELGQRHATLVSTTTLANIGHTWGLESHIQLGKGEQGPTIKPTIMADVVEALLGAIYLDGGLSAVQTVMHPVWQPLLVQSASKDAKTTLQEHLQAAGHPLPTYTVLAETGPDHAKQFTIQLTSALGQATGQGATKQTAQAAAAAALLAQLP